MSVTDGIGKLDLVALNSLHTITRHSCSLFLLNVRLTCGFVSSVATNPQRLKTTLQTLLGPNAMNSVALHPTRHTVSKRGPCGGGENQCK